MAGDGGTTPLLTTERNWTNKSKTDQRSGLTNRKPSSKRTYMYASTAGYG